MSYYYYPSPYSPYQPSNWNPNAAPPNSAPATSGAGGEIQFGSYNRSQMEAMQHGAPQPVYPYYSPYVPVMPYGYPPMAPGPAPGPQSHGPMQPPRERNPVRHDNRRGGGRTSQPQHRERNQEREGSHRDQQHQRTSRDPPHGHTRPSSRSDTPTSQHHREQPQMYHTPTSGGYPPQQIPASSMPMHPPPHPYQMPYYYSHAYPQSPYPSVSGPMSSEPQYYRKSSAKLNLEPGSTAPAPAPPAGHHMQMPEVQEVGSPKATSTPSAGKRRLPLINPNTQAPLVDVSNPQSQPEKLTPVQTKQQDSTVQPPGPLPKEETLQALSGGRDRPNKVVSKVQKTELKTGDTAVKRQPRYSSNFPDRERKIIDPSMGTHIVGLSKLSETETQDKTVNPITEKQPSTASKILRTVESVERHVEEEASAEHKNRLEFKEAEERVSEAKPVGPVKVMVGSQLRSKQEEPKSHPVEVKPQIKPVPEQPVAKEESKEPEEKSDVTEMKQTTPETPSKDVFTPSAKQEARKEVTVEVKSTAATETSESGSPMTKPEQSLSRRGSGKLGSRSNSYQTLRRNSSSSSRISKHAKTESGVFHVSSKKRIYTTDFLMSLRTQFTEKPQVQEGLFCLKDVDVPTGRRSISEKWGSKGRSFEDRGKQSLTRSGSGKDWGKGSSLASGGRRNSNKGYPGQRGLDETRWNRSDMSMTSPFAPHSSGGDGLHHTDNRYIVGEMISDDPEEEKRQKRFKGLLNKLTPSNFAVMYEKMREVEITSSKTLKGLIDQIFDKALIETTFCPLYSDLCKLLSSEMPEFEEEGDSRKITFRRLLLNKCQNEFEKGKAAAKSEEAAEAENSDDVSPEERQERILRAKKERMRSLGNMQFIGFLFKKGMLTEKIIHSCIIDLLMEEKNPKPEGIECLCQLLTTVGDLIASGPSGNMGAYFSRIERLSKNSKLETRHRFMLMDLIELRDRNWVERREKEGPKKIEEIHRDAQMEQMAQNARNRGRTYGGAYPERPSRNWQRSSTTRPTPSYNVREEVKPLTKNLSLGRTASSDISLRPSNIGGSKPGVVVTVPRPRSRSPSRPVVDKAPIEEASSEADKYSSISEEVLRRRVKSLVDEYYSVKDMTEALSCIEELIGQNAEKADILKSILLAGLDIRGLPVEERLKPIASLLKELMNQSLFEIEDAVGGLQITMAELPEIAEEFPKAPELIATLLGTMVSEGIIPLKPVVDPDGIILGAGREDNDDGDTELVELDYANRIILTALKQMKDEETIERSVRDALNRENADLTLFYPSYQRDDVDLSDVLQFLD